MVMEMEIYINYKSVKCLPIILLNRICDLNLNIIQYESLSKADQYQPTIKDMNICGCMSVIRYICHIYNINNNDHDNKVLNSLYPINNIQICAEIDSLIEMNESLFVHLSHLASCTTLNPSLSGEVASYHYEQVIKLLIKLQNSLPKANEDSYPWLISNQCTVADLIIISNLLLLNWCKFIDLHQFQSIVNWMDKIITNELISPYFGICTAEFGWFSVTSSILYGRAYLLRLVDKDPRSLSKTQTRKTSILSEVNFNWVALISGDALIDEIDSRYEGNLKDVNGIRVYHKHVSIAEEAGRHHYIASMNLPAASFPIVVELLKDLVTLYPKIEMGISNIRTLHDLSPSMKTHYIAADFKQESDAATRFAHFDFVVLHKWYYTPDGFVMVMTSLDDFQLKKGFVRSEFVNSGFVVRYSPNNTISITINFDLRFPARIPSWISRILQCRAQNYMSHIRDIIKNIDDIERLSPSIDTMSRCI